MNCLQHLWHFWQEFLLLMRLVSNRCSRERLATWAMTLGQVFFSFGRVCLYLPHICMCVYIYIYDLPDTPSLKRYMCEHTDYEHVYHRIRAFVELQLQSPATNHNGRLYPLHNTLKPHSFCTPILCVKGFLGVARIAGMKQHFRFISQKSIGVSLREWSARCKGHLLHDGCVHSI